MADTTMLDPRKIAKEGWLQKKSRHLGLWRRRWFVLSEHTLYSFKNEKVYESATELIDLRVYSSVKSSTDSTNKAHSFDVYSQDVVFSMIAKDDKDKEDWIRAIGKAIVMGHNNNTMQEP